MKKVRILLADDHQILRDGLRTLLNTQEDMEVIAEADTGRKAIDLALCAIVLMFWLWMW